MKQLLFFLALFCLCIKGMCQQTITPGDKNICYQLLKPQTINYKYTFYDSLGKKQREISVKDVIMVDSTYQQITRILYHELGGGKVLIDTTIAQLSTFKPIRMSMHTIPDFMHMDLQFEDTKIKARSLRNSQSINVVHEAVKGYFDSNLIEYLFGLLSYKNDTEYLLNAYIFEKNGTQQFIIKYVMDDYLITDSGEAKPVSVVLATSQDNNPYKVYCWIEKATGKTLKRIVPLGNGKTLVMQEI